jgi:hypothetical protein
LSAGGAAVAGGNHNRGATRQRDDPLLHSPRIADDCAESLRNRRKTTER